MRAKHTYISKKDNTERYSFKELSEKFEEDFENYTKFSEWVEENFDEITEYYETPYERTRNKVYASGNVWAIQNFNETHN